MTPSIGPQLHAIWQAHTAVPTPYMSTFGFAWERWAFEVERAVRQTDWKVTPEALLGAVLRWRQRRAKENRQIAGAWTSLKKISHFPEECVNDYAESLAEARAVPGRAVARSDKSAVLRATGRVAAVERPPQATGEVLARLLQDLRNATK
jgi:hypothetical protein